MLTLDDFFHLDEVEPHLAQLAAALDDPTHPAGLIIVAGLDPRPVLGSATSTASGAGFLPSGRSTIARILLRQMINTEPGRHAIVIAEDETVLRAFRRRRDRSADRHSDRHSDRQEQTGHIEVWPVEPPYTYASRITEAARRQPDMIVLDRLSAESVAAALDAARGDTHRDGICVIAELDTVFRGANVARHLLDLGATPDQLDGLDWVITVQRLPTLCACKMPSVPDELTRLRERYAALIDPDSACECFDTVGCDQCRHTGYYGDVIAFDIFRTERPFRLSQPSQLAMEAYVVRLALLGYVSPEDALQFESGQFHRTYNLLAASERALSDANSQLERKLLELEAANRVLEQRTEALFSLQEIGQALIGSTELDDLADKVCRRARELCGADRAILYVLNWDEVAEVIAVAGWPADLRGLLLDAEQVFKPWASTRPESYTRWPPGIDPQLPDVAGFRLRAGLSVPLLTQDDPVGLMIVHSTQKNSFAPGQTALLQTFANQAALAIQRARLIAELRAKIDALEAAQAGLARKERLERELELARDVQQSVLPHTFPQMAGYHFAARYQSARMVGGDFYDVIALEGCNPDCDQLGIVIADVSDKGIPAALYMALTRSLLLAEARRSPSPRAVLINVNRLLLELGQPNMFVTVFYGVLDRTTRRLTYARGGHDRPLVIRPGADPAAGITELGGRGTMLGLLGPELFQLSEETITLQPGERLILYTDGLMDVMAPDGQLFTREQLIALLHTHAALPPDDLCAAVFHDLAAYQGDADQYDDTTLLVVAVE